MLSEKALDIDYLTYKLEEKLKEQGKTLELDENDNIKGWDELKSDMKTQFPAMFETVTGDGKGKVIEENRLEKGDDRKTEPESLADALKMQYESKTN